MIIGDKMSIVGNYNLKVSKNGKIQIPKKLQSEFGDRVILAIDFDTKCIAVFPLNKWEEYKKTITKSNLDKNLMLAFENMLSSAKLVQVNEFGELLIAEDFLKLAEITETCWLLGMNNCFELWNKEKFDKYMAGLNDETIEDELRKLGF